LEYQESNEHVMDCTACNHDYPKILFLSISALLEPIVAETTEMVFCLEVLEHVMD
jgi:hypothetical protein